MRRSKYFISLQKDNYYSHKDSIRGFQHMLKIGMVRQENSGIYTWLPHGLLFIRKIQSCIRSILDRNDCFEILASVIQQSSLWHESGRYSAYGEEMLKFKDRKGVELLYGPTCEELVTRIGKSYISSYKNMPLCIYQFQNKFRDEIRPRGGIIRSREFLMKDAYSFCSSQKESIKMLRKFFDLYLEIFQKVNIRCIPCKSTSNQIGGDMSYEFLYPDSMGDSDFFYDPILDQNEIETYKDCLFSGKILAFTKEMHNEYPISIEQDNSLNCCKGVEIGHIFSFKDIYTSAMNFKYHSRDNKKENPFMGSYGIGVSRLACIIIHDALKKDRFYIPLSVSPWPVCIINLCSQSHQCQSFCEKIYEELGSKTCFYDDTHNTPGEKMNNSEKIGCALHIKCGKEYINSGTVEFLNLITGEEVQIHEDRLCFFIRGYLEDNT